MNIFMLPNLVEIVEDIFRPNVMKGAAWLDEYEPDWMSKIVPEKLDISSAELCICGQVFEGYSNRPDAVEDAEAYGFTMQDFDMFCTHFTGSNLRRRKVARENAVVAWCYLQGYNRCGWKTLDSLWLGEIYWRLDPKGWLGAVGA